MPVDLVFDMETSDPDDALTLCVLATHPRVNLRAVTITPGSHEQVGVVRHILERLGRGDLPVGVFQGGSNPHHVSAWHHKWLGAVPASTAAFEGPSLLSKIFREYPQGVLLTGAALKNPGTMMHWDKTVRIGTWVGQGGFAGDSVVPPEHRLAKFAGRETCPTFNFNGAPLLAEEMLASDRIGRRLLVSKNVCHGVIYDAALHARIKALPRLTPGAQLMFEGMACYLAGKAAGKAFHDPLAATVAIDPLVCEMREVECYRTKGEWGSRLAEGTRTSISISVDRERFFSVLTEV